MIMIQGALEQITQDIPQTDEEVEHCYEEFYDDVHTEFLKFGETVNFKGASYSGLKEIACICETIEQQKVAGFSEDNYDEEHEGDDIDAKHTMVLTDEILSLAGRYPSILESRKTRREENISVAGGGRRWLWSEVAGGGCQRLFDGGSWWRRWSEVAGCGCRRWFDGGGWWRRWWSEVAVAVGGGWR
ncbi:hypothetical protein C5167_016507 [Papaver somniferum]|nr:hypothetical protein C5167_016507 [Papaver somniferum]